MDGIRPILRSSTSVKSANLDVLSVMSVKGREKAKETETFWPHKLKLLLYMSIGMDLLQLGMTYIGFMILFILLLNA